MPMQVEDLAECQKWFTANKRLENEYAWKIDFKAMLDRLSAMPLRIGTPRRKLLPGR